MYYLLTNRLPMLNFDKIELINWVPYLFKSYKWEWDYIIYFNLLGYFVWATMELHEWLYEEHDSFDIDELMYLFNGIEEDSPAETIKKALSSFVNIAVSKWWIDHKTTIMSNLNKVAAKEFAAYEKYITPEVVKKATEKKIFSDNKSDIEENRMFDSLKKFKTLSEIRVSRWINYNTLKNGMGTRVVEVSGGYVLAEDIILEYKKNYWI